VHLADWPRPAGHRDERLEAAMAAIRDAVGLGRAARTESKLRVRQPLSEAVVACDPASAEAMAPLSGLIASELNVRDVRFVTEPRELVRVTLKPNYRTLGPRFGPRMPAAAAAVAHLDAAAAVAALDGGAPVTVHVDGAAETLGPDDVMREVRPSEGYAVAQGPGMAVGLRTDVTPELRLEGMAREIVHAVQGARRTAGLRVEDRIALHLDGSAPLREAIDAHRTVIGSETLAVRLSVGHGAPFSGHHEEHELDGEPLAIRLEPVTA
jgi:isoleucyl-tRNA synthetase